MIYDFDFCCWLFCLVVPSTIVRLLSPTESVAEANRCQQRNGVLMRRAIPGLPGPVIFWAELPSLA
jgi:hypothetical protein